MKKAAAFISVSAAAIMLAACGDTSKMDSILAADNSKSAAGDISKSEAASKADDTSSQSEVSLNAVDSAVIAEAEKTASKYILDSTPTAADEYGLDSIDMTNGDIDIDLTRLDSNIVYAQVFDMLNEPDKYIGKKVRANGSFAYTTDPSTGGEYFAVFIADAAACCQQGMEFVLTGTHKYPDDYPKVGDSITVEGEFNTYTENGWQYCQLKDATLQEG